MAKMISLELEGTSKLAKKLMEKSEINYNIVHTKSLTEIYNRGTKGGTPILTGQLRQSLRKGREETGYIVNYAPHVEYGHRTLNGGFVKGQHFLQKNVEIQAPIFKQDLLTALRR